MGFPSVRAKIKFIPSDKDQMFYFLLQFCIFTVVMGIQMSLSHVSWELEAAQGWI